MAPDHCSVGFAAATVVLGLLLASWGLEELAQPKNVQVPGDPVIALSP